MLICASAAGAKHSKSKGDGDSSTPQAVSDPGAATTEQPMPAGANGGSPGANDDDEAGAAANLPKMGLEEARDYMLSLINRDRALFGAPPVRLDPIATKAAQWHADEMGKNVFNSHWHPDGKKPPQRYTECGGMDYDGENSHGTANEEGFATKMAEQQTFTPAELEKEERCYFDEQPPNDGHRRNILEPQHTNVGLGLVLMDLGHKESGTHYRQVVSSQEFIDHYGAYSRSADEFVRNVPFVLSGNIAPYLSVQSVQVTCEDLPEPIELRILSEEKTGPFHGGYGPAMQNVISAFPPAYAQKPDAQLMQQGHQFRCQLIPSKKWKPGLYYVTLWVNRNMGNKEAFPISMITVPLQGKK
jgi:uncharacterized protein YkwD